MLSSLLPKWQRKSSWNKSRDIRDCIKIGAITRSIARMSSSTVLFIGLVPSKRTSNNYTKDVTSDITVVKAELGK